MWAAGLDGSVVCEALESPGAAGVRDYVRSSRTGQDREQIIAIAVAGVAGCKPESSWQDMQQ